MTSFLLGLLGGFIAWIATTFFAQPLIQFLNLRTQAAEALARFEDQIDLGTEDEFRPSEQWIDERRSAYQACGSRLIAFATSNAIIASWLYRLWPKHRRYFARAAGSGLMALASANPGTQASEYIRKQIVSALRLNYRPSTKPGKALLVTGVVAYAATLLALLLYTRSYRQFQLVELLAIVPFAIGIAIFFLAWSAFCIGTITGTPWVSFTYGFSIVWRFWRGILAIALLSAAVFALFTGWPHFRF